MAKKELVITLVKSELIYEVQNKTYLTGRSRETGDNHEQVANMQMNDDEEHKNQILRSLGDAYRELKTKLSNYLVDTAVKSSDVQEMETGDFKLMLNMPSNFNQSVADSITAACHKYMVNTAICDWFTITKPDEAKSYADLSAISIQAIRESVNKRTTPKRVIPEVSTT
ncbi:hypothetical protein [Bacteroides sp.]|uniref:hypothetical protein n=1 Tax=Bacteroides sp. TaxID=29523 RepID=UPI002601DA1C|nr:hypothetical protein [Bacteroides sp.]MDD3037141.1 hypothetical protein [Bacteroides sp.]